MDSTSRVLLQPKHKKKRPSKLRTSIQKLSTHMELVAALISGGIILFAWIYTAYLSHAVWIGLHLGAFVIGGFAKAKEGIEETIQNKRLNVEMLMVFAAIGAAFIGYWTEGAILIFIFALSGALETYTLQKSNREISALMNLQPETALLIYEGEQRIVPVSDLSIGDLVLVRAGERIPADGMITVGSTAVDESAITGESLPVEKELESEVFAGTVALNGSIQVKITKPASETLFQKIINMVQSAQAEKSPSQLFIEKFEGTYVNVVLIIVGIMMFLPYLLFDWPLSESIYRAMILLVVASPCALVASIMPATLSAISKSARSGVLFKGGVHVENLGHVKAIALDKTGTLTNGQPVVTDAYFAVKADEAYTTAIIGKIEQESTHPLAKAIASYSAEAMKKFDITMEQVKTIAGKGISAIQDGIHWEISKPQQTEAEQSFHHGILEKLAAEGKTVVCARKDGELVAVFALKDTIRSEAKAAITLLKQNGIYTVMLTGDNPVTAKAIALEAGLDDYIANCLPVEKVKQIKRLRKQYGNVAMIGDGINDAPALATANVGIAMGEGTDVALETADMVLMQDDLEKITHAISLSKKMNQIVKQNIFFSIAVISVLILSNFFQVIDMPLGVIGHEGSTILVILNGLRLLK